MFVVSKIFREEEKIVACKHELYSSEVCVFCNGRSRLLQITEPSTDKEPTVIISTDTDTQRTKSQVYKKINSAVTQVNIVGHPFLWALEEIFAKGTRVKTIQLAPRHEARISQHTKDLVLRHGATIVYEHVRPWATWKTKTPRHPRFENSRKFFLALGKKDQKTLEEMLEFGFIPVLVTRRYLCLDDQPYETLEQVGKSFGFSALQCSIYVNATRKFFDRKFKCSGVARVAAKALRTKLRRARLRKKTVKRDKEERQKYLESVLKLVEKISTKLTIEVPINLKPSYQGAYLFLLECLADGRIAKLRRKKPKYWKVVSLRYGLDGSNVCKTLKQVSVKTKTTHEAVRQTETKALRRLGMPKKLRPYYKSISYR